MFILADKYDTSKLKEEALTRLIKTLIGEDDLERLIEEDTPNWWSPETMEDLEKIVNRIVGLGRLILNMDDIPGKHILVNVVFICVLLLKIRGRLKLKRMKDFIQENCEAVAHSELSYESFVCKGCERPVLSLGKYCTSHGQWACGETACVEEVANGTVCFHCVEIRKSRLLECKD
jgi:hypothetical protein